MNKQTTWILVADGSRARIFRAADKGRIELHAESAIPHPPSRDINADRPGRTFDSAGLGRHAKEPPTDPHDKAEADFLHTLAQQIDNAHAKKEFDRLVVIAAPRALGTLRTAFPKRVSEAVVTEMAHDLTGFAAPALETYLKDHDVI